MGTFGPIGVLGPFPSPGAGPGRAGMAPDAVIDRDSMDALIVCPPGLRTLGPVVRDRGVVHARGGHRWLRSSPPHDHQEPGRSCTTRARTFASAPAPRGRARFFVPEERERCVAPSVPATLTSTTRDADRGSALRVRLGARPGAARRGRGRRPLQRPRRGLRGGGRVRYAVGHLLLYLDGGGPRPGGLDLALGGHRSTCGSAPPRGPTCQGPPPPDDRWRTQVLDHAPP